MIRCFSFLVLFSLSLPAFALPSTPAAAEVRGAVAEKLIRALRAAGAHTSLPLSNGQPNLQINQLSCDVSQPSCLFTQPSQSETPLQVNGPIANQLMVALKNAEVQPSSDGGFQVASIQCVTLYVEGVFPSCKFPSSNAVSSTTKQGKILLLVSVDWEGREIQPDNIQDMAKFRKQYPMVPLLHFLNAAYFTKPDANPDRIQSQINSVLLPDDDLGLHIHGWKSLFEASGVFFKDAPTLWGTRIAECVYDCGHEVPIDLYSVDELRKVIRFSTKTLSAYGYGKATHFRTGAWLGAPNVLEALVQEGFTVDSSEVPPELLKPQLGLFPIYKWVSRLWGSTKITTQPHSIETPAGRILEIPDNGALADYMEASQMMAVFQAGVETLKQNPDRDVLVHIGFHQETAHRYLSRVVNTIDGILRFSKQNKVPVHFVNRQDLSKN